MPASLADNRLMNVNFSANICSFCAEKCFYMRIRRYFKKL